MGFRSGFVISSVSFLFGTIFIAAIYDFPLLYASRVDAESVEAAERFYLSLYGGPTAVTALFHGMIALGIIGLIAKLHRWNEMAKYFDGGSLVLYMGAVCMYGGVSVPNLRLLADPGNMNLLNRSAIMTQRQQQREAFDKGQSGYAPPDGPMTPDERISAIRIVSATNTIAAALLAGVLLLQVSEWYLERQESQQQQQNRRKQSAELAAAHKEKATVSSESKKDK